MRNSENNIMTVNYSGPVDPFYTLWIFFFFFAVQCAFRLSLLTDELLLVCY